MIWFHSFFLFFLRWDIQSWIDRSYSRECEREIHRSEYEKLESQLRAPFQFHFYALAERAISCLPASIPGSLVHACIDGAVIIIMRGNRSSLEYNCVTVNWNHEENHFYRASYFQHCEITKKCASIFVPLQRFSHSENFKFRCNIWPPTREHRVWLGGESGKIILGYRARERKEGNFVASAYAADWWICFSASYETNTIDFPNFLFVFLFREHAHSAPCQLLSLLRASKRGHISLEIRGSK